MPVHISPPSPRDRRILDADVVRRNMRTSTLDGSFAVQYATLATGPFLMAFLLALGASEFQVGLVAAFPLLAGLAQPVGAEIIRMRGGWRKGVCLTGALIEVLLWSVSLGAVIWLDASRAVPLLIGVLGLQYTASAFTGVAWTSWISDLIPASLRGRYFGNRNFICNAFGMGTAVAAGLVVRHGGFPAIPTFMVLVGLGAACRLVSIGYLYRQDEPFPAQSHAGRFVDRLSQPVEHRAFRRYLTFEICWSFSVQLSAPFFTVYTIRQIGAGTDVVMAMAAISTGANLLGQRFWGPLCDRHGDRTVMRTTGLIVALQPFWWLLTQPSGWGFYLMGLLSVSGGFAWSGMHLATGNLKMRLAPETGKTTFFAAQAAMSGVSGAAGPLLGGLFADALLSGLAPLPGTALAGLKTLFLVSGLLRLGAWALLQRIPAPPRLSRAPTRLARVTLRPFNLTQGISGWLLPLSQAEELTSSSQR